MLQLIAEICQIQINPMSTVTKGDQRLEILGIPSLHELGVAFHMQLVNSVSTSFSTWKYRTTSPMSDTSLNLPIQMGQQNRRSVP